MSVLGIFFLVFGILLVNHLIYSQQTDSITELKLFQYGTEAGDLQVARGFASSPPLALITPFTFFGKKYTEVVVNYNGVVSFGTEGFTEYYARPFPFRSPPFVAPFWDDIDSLFWEGLYYSQTNDSNLLQQFYNYSLLLLEDDSNSEVLNGYYPIHLFVATWDEVPKWEFLFQETRLVNTFQVIIGTNGTTTLAVFLYKDIQWRLRAQIGFNAGDGYSSFTPNEVQIDPNVNVDNSSNVGLPGVFIFRIDDLSLVECFEALECTNSTKSLGMMTAPDCCVRTTSEGLAYTKPGSVDCHICVVFGWFQESYVGVEQEFPHIVTAGYWKGAQKVQRNLAFIINEISIRDSPDLMVVPSEVRLIFDNPQNSTVNVSFLTDDIAQEYNETITLVLVPLPTTNLPTGEGVFFLNTTDMIIIDTDILDVYFTLKEYTSLEADEQLIISVCKNKKTYADFSVKVLAVDDDSPNRAISQKDFDNRTHILEFFSDTMCHRVQIDIVNDNINEADEVFTIQLTLSYSLSPNLITLSQNASFGFILDDDPIRIGFVKPEYTFIEPPVPIKTFSIPLVKEGGRVSEQTFTLQIDVSNMTNLFQPATSGDDFEHVIANITIHPNEQTVMWEFKLISNDIAEENEAFHVTVSSVGHPKFLSNNNSVFNTTTIVINDPQSLVGFIQDIYTVREDQGFMNLSLFVFNFSVDAFEVNFTTFSENNAIEGKDYEQVSTRISIAGNETTVISIPIINDDLAEGLEVVYGRLQIISPPTNSPPSTITIEIIDDEVKGVCGNTIPSLKSNCSADALCEVSSNGRNLINCSCKEGYLGTGPICHNINECETGQHKCDVNANCSDTPGSYECHCKESFFGNGTICLMNANKLPDTCDEESADCTCFSLINGSTECGCSIGYELNNENDSFICQDIDECNGGNPCLNGTCENTNGSYECFCKHGYILDSSGKKCVDLDECTLEFDDCNDNAVCNNNDGGYSCSCKRNYFGNGKLCFAMNNCNETCSQGCISKSNSSDSVFCGCRHGYYLSSDLRNCEDINECKLSNISNCDENADCINTVGSYECQCKAGFQGNGIICKDIDECITGFHDCDENANCSNTEGSFNCTCKESYFGNGKKCEAGFSPTIQAANATDPVLPNHHFFYSIGRSFCLEGNDTIPPDGATINCMLEEMPEPPPKFKKIITRVFSDLIVVYYPYLHQN